MSKNMQSQELFIGPPPGLELPIYKSEDSSTDSGVCLYTSESTDDGAESFQAMSSVDSIDLNTGSTSKVSGKPIVGRAISKRVRFNDEHGAANEWDSTADEQREPQKLEVIVHDEMTGQRLSSVLDRSDYVLDAKRQIRELLGVELGEQRLFFNGVLVNDMTPLNACKANHEESVLLSLVRHIVVLIIDVHTGATHSVVLDSSPETSYILDVKHHLKKTTGVPLVDQGLFLGSKRLTDFEDVHDLQSGGTLILKLVSSPRTISKDPTRAWSANVSLVASKQLVMSQDVDGYWSL